MKRNDFNEVMEERYGYTFGDAAYEQIQHVYVTARNPNIDIEALAEFCDTYDVQGIARLNRHLGFIQRVSDQNFTLDQLYEITATLDAMQETITGYHRDLHVAWDTISILEERISHIRSVLDDI